MGRNILVVEDDRNICDLIHMYLVKEGFDVRIAGDGGKAIEEFQKQVPDLILLDIMLPVMDGWSVCAKIRETSKVPIIMLTAKGEVFDRIQGLEMGADDYVVKPFEMKELIARINAVLRRTEIPNDTSKRLTFDKLVIDLDSYELIVDGKKIDTPPKELELLYHLASTPNRVYTRNQLLDEVWGFDYFGDSRTVDVHIKRLREKIENVSSQWALKTVWVQVRAGRRPRGKGELTFPGTKAPAPRKRRQAVRRTLEPAGIHFRQVGEMKGAPGGLRPPGKTAASGR